MIINTYIILYTHTIMEYKEPNKIICGICQSYIKESDNPKGELGYDNCEDFEKEY